MKNTKKIVSLIIAVALMAGCFGLFSLSAAAEPVMMYVDDQPNHKVHDLTNTDVGVRFNANAEFDAIVIPLYTYEKEDGHSITFKLYKWDTNYATTVAKAVVASKTVNNLDNGGKVAFDFTAQAAGEYLAVLTDSVKANGHGNAVFATPAAFANVQSYEKGVIIENQALEFSVRFTGETNPATPFVALSESTDKPVERPSVTFDGKKFFVYEAEDNVTTVDVENGPSGCPANVVWPFSDAYPDDLPTSSNGHVVMRFWGAGTMYPFTAENGKEHADFAGKAYTKACSVDLKVTVEEAGTYEVRVHGSALEAIAGKFVVNGVDKNFTYTAYGKPSTPGTDYKDCKFGLIATVNLELKAGENTISLVSLAPGHAETIQPDAIYVAAVKGASTNAPTGDLSIMQFAAVAILAASSMIIKRKSK